MTPAGSRPTASSARRLVCGCCGCSRSRSSSWRSSRRWRPGWASSRGRASPTSSATGSACAGRHSRCSSCSSPTSPIPSPSSPAPRRVEIFGVPRILPCRSSPVAIWTLVIFASYRTVERVFLSVIVVFIAYVVSAFLAEPDWGEVGRALVTPSLDPRAARPLLMVALVGTTITPYILFYMQASSSTKGSTGGAGPRAGGRVRRRALDQRDRVLHRRRDRHHDPPRRRPRRLGRGRGAGARRRSPASSPGAVRDGPLRASLLAAMMMPLSTAFVICEAFGWESGVGKSFRDAPVFFLDLHADAGAWRDRRPDPGTGPDPADHRLAEPPGTAAPGRAGVHGPAGQRRAADGPLPQRADAERAGVGGGGLVIALDVVLLGTSLLSAFGIGG